MPRSLRVQTLVVLIFGLIVSHMIGLSIYSLDRKRAVTSTEALDFAERAVGIVHLLQRLPIQWREDIAQGYESRMFRVTLDSFEAPVELESKDELTGEITEFLHGHFPEWPRDRMHVRYSPGTLNPAKEAAANQASLTGSASATFNSDGNAYDVVHISMQLEDYQWLNFSALIPRSDTLWPGAAGAYILSVALAIGAVVMWLVARVTAPLSRFAVAADRLGKNIRAEPMSESGPTEVAQAARALNEMQERLQRLVENRTQMLAAISHDLRTPLTLLRLRAELLPDSDEKTRILGTTDDMETMIASVLEFARGTFHDEPQRQVDVSSLVGNICGDLADAGAEIAFAPAGQILYSCRQTALRRALTNVIENALKYGGVARVEIEERPDAIEVSVEDDGPGIPPELLDKIFMPFFRVDGARSREKGGAGLGLSIAQTIIHGHGGTMQPENRPEGGFRVSIALPH